MLSNANQLFQLPAWAGIDVGLLRGCECGYADGAAGTEHSIGFKCRWHDLCVGK